MLQHVFRLRVPLLCSGFVVGLLSFVVMRAVEELERHVFRLRVPLL
jgi:hypothetical protein